MLAWYSSSVRYQPDCDGAEGGRLHPAGLRIKPSLANLDITKTLFRRAMQFLARNRLDMNIFERYKIKTIQYTITYVHLC
jgi:hypothetical protein